MAEQVCCTTCGSELTVPDSRGTRKCPVCGNTYVGEYAVKLAKVEVDRTAELKNNRQMLAMAMKHNDAKSICDFASSILQIIPEDYSANYCFAFGQYLHNNPGYLYEFLDTNKSLYTFEELDNVLTHLFGHSALSDRNKIEAYLESLKNIDTDSAIESYHHIYQKRRRQEDMYDMYPRDVFLSYHIDDQRIAERTVEVLEAEGYKCWAEYRNFNPDNRTNYKENINAAIASCRVFIVVSDEAAMMSPKVKAEMNTALALGKEKLEFKIDYSQPTNLFAGYFQGTWIDGTRFDNQAVRRLAVRIAELQKAVPVIPEPSRSALRQGAGSGDISEIERTAKDYCTKGDYESALKIYMRLAQSRPESFRAWLGIVCAMTKNYTDADETNHLQYLERAFRVADDAEKTIINNEYAPLKYKRQQLVDMYGRNSGSGYIKLGFGPENR